MSQPPLVKIKAARAADICAHFVLKDAAQALLRDGMVPGEFIEALAANKQYIAAIDFIAHALPPREAIWWGCLCLQHAGAKSLSPADTAAAQAAAQWLIDPTEE